MLISILFIFSRDKPICTIMKIAPVIQKIIFSSVLFLIVNYSTAQWVPVQGMDGADVYKVLVKDSLVFLIGNGQGISKRNMNNGTWHKVLNTTIYSLVKAGDYIVGLWPYSFSTLFRTLDNGVTWDTISLSNLSPNDLVAINNSLFMAASHNLFRSDDFGITWYSIQNNIAVIGSGQLFANDTTLIYFNNNPKKIYYSENSGLHWDSLSTAGLGIYTYSELKDIFKFQSNFWMASDRIFKYNSSSNNWMVNDTTKMFDKFGSFSGNLYGGGAGVYRLAPDNTTWIAENNGLETNLVKDLFATDSLLVCGSVNGVYKTDTSLSWSSYNEGLHGGWIHSIASKEDEVWVCSGIGLFKSTDGGMNFTRKPFSQPGEPWKIVLTDSLYFLHNDYNLFESIDSGETWNIIPTPSIFNYYINDFAVGSQFIFLLKGDTLYRAPISSYSWQKIPFNSNPLQWFRQISAHDSTILFCSNGSSLISYPVYISHDNGFTIDTVSDIQQGYSPIVKYDGTRFFTGEGASLRYSGDNGYTWTPFQPVNYFVEDCSSKDAIFVMSGLYPYSFGPGASISYDQGLTWSDIVDNLAACGSDQMPKVGIAQERLLIGTSGNGLWYRNDLLTGINPVAQTSKGNLRVIPNPAASMIFITFTSEGRSSGSIKIVDLSGRQVYDSGSKIINSGQSSYPVDIRNFSDGIYLVLIITDDIVYTSKFQVHQ